MAEGMQNLLTVDNHSFREDLLTGGPVLDAGARGFVFAKWFAERGHEVWALDPSHEIEVVPSPNIKFLRSALVPRGQAGKWFYLHTEVEDREAWHVDTTPTEHKVESLSLATWDYWDDKPWDLVKLNIEGLEYDILKDWPGPISRQIVASFHQHCAHARRSEEEIASVVAHLERWYKTVRHVKDDRYCAGFNYWDSVWVLRGLPNA